MNSNSDNSELNKTVDHLFRHGAGKMVSVLTRIFGFSNIGEAEDIVQDTILKALQTWRYGKIPENPEAWLYRAAKNNAIDIIRRDKLKYKIENEISILLKSEYTLVPAINEMFTENEIKDSQLRMMFACCHPQISLENQITLILKILCGFSTAEVAKSFLISEDTVSKRLYRTKEFFRLNKIKLEMPSGNEIKNRTNSVLNAIYLLFNEGYNSTHSKELIRTELIEEALTLCKLLSESPHTQLPEVYALMALIYFHSSRSESRLSNEGEIILLSGQDRNKWDKAMILKGNEYLKKAAFGNEITSYHLEAAIAFEHCTSESFQKTNWELILGYYESLCKIITSPISQLNRIIALMQVSGPSIALKELENLPERNKLESYYLYHSLLGDIYSKLNDSITAKNYYEKAIRLTQSNAEKKMLRNKITPLLN